MSVQLADDIDVGRGDVIVSAAAEDAHLPVVARELEATVCWLAEKPLHAGDRVALKHGTTTVRATVQSLDRRLDPDSLIEQVGPSSLELNDIGTVTLRTSSVVLADKYSRTATAAHSSSSTRRRMRRWPRGPSRTRGRWCPVRQPRNDIKWHPSSLARNERWRKTGQRGATVWLTGLPASANPRWRSRWRGSWSRKGRVAYLLDGDNIRHGISDDLGFSPGDRAENIRRVGHLARLFADSGVIAIASLVSPLRSDREIARELHDAADLDFVEVHVATPVSECERRDPKGSTNVLARGRCAV